MLIEKDVDLVVFNDVGRPDIGFESPDNEVLLISLEGELHVPKATKQEVAGAILDAVQELLGDRS